MGMKAYYAQVYRAKKTIENFEGVQQKLQETNDKNLIKQAGDPFWRTFKVTREPLLFIKYSEGAAPKAKLLFKSVSDLIITDSTGEIVYKPSKDYTWDKGSNLIKIGPKSRIPFKKYSEIYPPLDQTDSSLIMSTDRKRKLLYKEGHYFHELQVMASYKHNDKWKGSIPSASNNLSRFRTKLKHKSIISLVVLGDSISEGYNASGFVHVNSKPFQPAYPKLVANGLENKFNVSVKLVNFSSAGAKTD